MYVIFFMLALFLKIHISVLEIFWPLPGTSESKIICSFSLRKIPVTFLFQKAVSKDRMQEWIVCIDMCIHVYLS